MTTRNVRKAGGTRKVAKAKGKKRAKKLAASRTRKKQHIKATRRTRNVKHHYPPLPPPASSKVRITSIAKGIVILEEPTRKRTTIAEHTVVITEV